MKQVPSFRPAKQTRKNVADRTLSLELTDTF